MEAYPVLPRCPMGIADVTAIRASIQPLHTMGAESRSPVPTKTAFLSLVTFRRGWRTKGYYAAIRTLFLGSMNAAQAAINRRLFSKKSVRR